MLKIVVGDSSNFKGLSSESGTKKRLFSHKYANVVPYLIEDCFSGEKNLSPEEELF